MHVLLDEHSALESEVQSVSTLQTTQTPLVPLIQTGVDVPEHSVLLKH
jgi:hypothetical protein